MAISAKARTIIVVTAGVLLVAGIIFGIFLASQDEAPAPDDPAAATTEPMPESTPGELPTPTDVPTAPAPVADDPIAVEQAPVLPTETATAADGVTVRLVKIENVDAVAQAPGETSGAAIRLTVEIINNSSSAVDGAFVAVNAYAGEERAPLDPVMNPGGVRFDGEIAAGSSSTGVYLFRVEDYQKDNLLVGVDVIPDGETATFKGSFN